MNAYFFNVSNEERSNILDKHKEIYDGYVTQYGKGNNQQPLYTQDYANDKGGITVNNRGDVGEYRNININEMRHDGKDTGLFSDEATESIKDTIGDGPLDLENGTVDLHGDNDDDINYELDDLLDELDDEESFHIQEQLNKTIDMFRRFNKY
jgi:hypothetical protein